MSIYQCDECGCAENTSLGWYHSRNNERLTPDGYLGKALCSACAPTYYGSGAPNKFNGNWHNKFIRHFLPHGSCFTNRVGNLEHKESGLIGNELYEKHAKLTPYIKARG